MRSSTEVRTRAWFPRRRPGMTCGSRAPPRAPRLRVDPHAAAGVTMETVGGCTQGGRAANPRPGPPFTLKEGKMTSTSSSVGTSETYGSKAAGTAIAHGEGLVAGLIGAATIAVWFFILDLLKGRPFYTPSVLGTVVFRGLTNPDILRQP